MTLSDLLYLCALFAVIVGVTLVALAFLGIVAGVGAAFLATAFALWRASQAFEREASSEWAS